ELGIDLSLERLTETRGHRQCALWGYISLEREIVSLGLGQTVFNDQIGRKAQIGASRRGPRKDDSTTVTSIKGGGRVGGRSDRSGGRLCHGRWWRRCLRGASPDRKERNPQWE